MIAAPSPTLVNQRRDVKRYRPATQPRFWLGKLDGADPEREGLGFDINLTSTREQPPPNAET